MPDKKPTLQLVADMAGVSRGTVDRVLKNRPHVRPEVYERVSQALRESGYLSYKRILPPSEQTYSLPSSSNGRTASSGRSACGA